MIKVLDHGYVRFVEAWGGGDAYREADTDSNEAGIIEAARQSTQGSFRGWEPTACSCCAGHSLGWAVDKYCQGCHGNGVGGDQKLLRYLYEHKHATPFEFAGMTIEVQAPLMVFREWHRHRTQSYNEMSGRYTELPNLYYIPSVERIMAGKQSTTNAQGSEEGITKEMAVVLQQEMSVITTTARRTYELLLAKGVAKEVARLILPVNQYSRMRVTANLRNWLAFLTLRMDPAAQWEIRQYANVVAGIIEQQFPRTAALFFEGKEYKCNTTQEGQ